jgi:hypothetical protein
MAHIYDIGTRAWQPDTTEGWVASEVTDKQIAGDKVKLVFKLENGEVRTTTAAGKGLAGLWLTIHCADQIGRDHHQWHPDRQ